MNNYSFNTYDPENPTVFESIRTDLHLNNKFKVEHVGSTSVVGLGGKGVIDVLIISENEDEPELYKILYSAGYKLRSDFDKSIMHVSHTKMVLVKNKEYQVQIHISSKKSKHTSDLITFRDYLRTHPQEVEKYSEAKKTASEKFSNDPEQYLKAKSGEISRILADAKNK